MLSDNKELSFSVFPAETPRKIRKTFFSWLLAIIGDSLSISSGPVSRWGRILLLDMSNKHIG